MRQCNGLHLISAYSTNITIVTAEQVAHAKVFVRAISEHAKGQHRATLNNRLLMADQISHLVALCTHCRF